MDPRPLAGEEGDPCYRAKGDRNALLSNLGDPVLGRFRTIRRQDIHIAGVCLEQIYLISIFSHGNKLRIGFRIPHGF